MPENNNQPPKLTPELALNVVTSAVRQLKLSYEEHVYLDQCLKVLTENQTKEVEKVEKNEKSRPPRAISVPEVVRG